jgi:hypothetical protein
VQDLLILSAGLFLAIQAFNLEIPDSLRHYVATYAENDAIQLFDEAKELLEAARSTNLESIINVYHQSVVLNNTWGTAYHYISLQKQW